MRRAVAAAIVTLAAVGTLAACRVDAAEKPPPPPLTIPGRVDNQGTRDVTASGRLTLELRDHAYKPTFLKALPGEDLSLTLVNTSASRHTFTLADVTNSVDMLVLPHRTVHVEVVAPLSGALVFFCRFHRSLGMQGAIFTAPGTPVIGAPGGVTSTTTPYPTSWLD